jgi:hypothetical protein
MGGLEEKKAGAFFSHRSAILLSPAATLSASKKHVVCGFLIR